MNEYLYRKLSISLHFKRLNDLNSGSVCAIGQLNDIVQMALFW